MKKHFHTGHDNIVDGLFRPTLLSRGLVILKGWSKRRRAIRELSAMPDALLRDIGIERHQINDAVHNFGRRPAGRFEVVKMPVEKIIAAMPMQKAA